MGGEERETLGHLYASQIASHLALRNSDEKRTLLLGLGLGSVEGGGEAFYDLLELVLQVL
jgi:proteasome assembly chaperone 3